MKKIGIIIVIILLLIIFSFIAIAGAGYYLNKSNSELPDESVVFIVNEGSSFNLIADKLEDEDLIRSALFLKVFNRIPGFSFLVKRGTYSIEKNLTSLEIVKQLVDGKQKLIKVVIPEGLTVRKIARILSESGVADSEEFIKAAKDGSYLENYNIEAPGLEGFLFPDTYSFQKDFPASKIARHMVDVFFKKLDTVYPDYKMLTSSQIYNKVVLSSIIEKEYRVPEEASRIASIFYNRIDQDWPLQSCATIVYVITEEQMKEHPERILYSHLEINSDFNTYKYQGLPPAPISNPGFVALDAVFNPDQTDYMFFVVKDLALGTHTFTRTLTDHVKAKQDYLSNFRSR